MKAPAVSYEEALSRENQKNFRPEPGKRFWWRGRVRIPAGTEVDRPLVVEVDEIRLVTGIWFDGKPLRLPQKPAGEAWSAGEGAVVLPVGNGFSEGVLCLQAGWLTQIYPNGIGRVRIRPATLRESVVLNRPASIGGSVVAKNLTGATLAWSGQNPRAKAYDRKVGVFQMAWNNPHPEKTIESIDILSPGKVGEGQAFIFGISAANKKTEP